MLPASSVPFFGGSKEFPASAGLNKLNSTKWYSSNIGREFRMLGDFFSRAPWVGYQLCFAVPSLSGVRPRVSGSVPRDFVGHLIQVECARIEFLSPFAKAPALLGTFDSARTKRFARIQLRLTCTWALRFAFLVTSSHATGWDTSCGSQCRRYLACATEFWIGPEGRSRGTLQAT